MKDFRKFFLLILIVIGLVSALVLDRTIEKKEQRQTLEMSDAEIAELSGVYIKVPAQENDRIPFDINSISLEGDSTLYILLPYDADISELVYYVMTPWDEYACRRVTDFTQEEDVYYGLQKVCVIQSVIPIMYFQADDEEYSSFRKSVNEEFDREAILNVEMCLSGYSDHEADTDCEAAIHLRGNGSAVGPTKPYSLKLNVSKNLLGMGKAQKWNLLANWQDKTLLKNEVFYKLAEEIGLSFSPKAQPISLFFNGNYQGVYLLTSKIKAGKETINIGGDDFLINWGIDYTDHGVTYEADEWFEEWGIDDVKNQVEVEYPEDNSADERISETIQRLADTLESGGDLSELIDIDSFAKFYWVMEASMNFDAGCSTYSYYISAEDKFYMGPVWDLDLSLGAVELKQDNDFTDPTGWKVRNLSFWKPFFEDEEFSKRVEELYFDEISESIDDSLRYYRDMAEEISLEGELNFQKRRDEIENYAIHYDEAENYEDQIELTTDFYEARIEWLKQEMEKQTD